MISSKVINNACHEVSDSIDEKKKTSDFVRDWIGQITSHLISLLPFDLFVDLLILV